MLTLCAWCERDGVRTVLKETDELGEHSHGICRAHLALVREEIRAMRPFVGPSAARDAASGAP